MHSYFVLNDKSVLPLIGAVSFSSGDGLELSQRYGYDYSKKPQSLTHRKRNTALTVTIQTSFNPLLCAENNIMMMDYISDLEHICGQKVDFYWNTQNMGSFVIQSVQFSGATDAVQILSGMAVSLSMTEGYVRRENLETAVKAL